MDDRRFDALARALAKNGNRRTLMQGLILGGVATGIATSDRDALAARRPSVTPTQTPKCPSQQTWNGSACVCPDGNTICGPDCCPDGQAVCCDSACCYGECYGEELCCADGSSVCHNRSCCLPGDVCLDDGSCCTPQTCGAEPPASLFGCGSGPDGCGGTLDCTCPENWLCIERASGNICANLTNECLPGVTAEAYGDVGLCAQTAGFCATSATSEATQCVSLSQAMCTDCTQDTDCGAISGGVCIQSWSAVCSTRTMCAQAL